MADSANVEHVVQQLSNTSIEVLQNTALLFFVKDSPPVWIEPLPSYEVYKKYAFKTITSLTIRVLAAESELRKCLHEINKRSRLYEDTSAFLRTLLCQMIFQTDEALGWFVDFDLSKSNISEVVSINQLKRPYIGWTLDACYIFINENTQQAVLVTKQDEEGVVLFGTDDEDENSTGLSILPHVTKGDFPSDYNTGIVEQSSQSWIHSETMASVHLITEYATQGCLEEDGEYEITQECDKNGVIVEYETSKCAAGNCNVTVFQQIAVCIVPIRNPFTEQDVETWCQEMKEFQCNFASTNPTFHGYKENTYYTYEDRNPSINVNSSCSEYVSYAIVDISNVLKPPYDTPAFDKLSVLFANATFGREHSERTLKSAIQKALFRGLRTIRINSLPPY